MADLIEKLLQTDIYHHVITLFHISLGLGHRLVRTSPWTKAVTELGKRRVPAPLKPLKHGLLDQPINHTRNAQFAFLLASRLRYFDPFDHLRLVSTVKQLVFDFRPLHLQEVGQFVDAHAIDTRTSLIGADLFERGMQIVALEYFFHQMLTQHRAFGGLSRCKRITPRSRSPGLHPSFPVKGHLNRFTGFRIAHKIKLLLTSPYRSGLQYPEVPTMPSADSWGAIKAIAGPSVRFGALSFPNTPQASRGKFMSFRCTTAGFTPLAFDGYGLRDLTLTRPTSAPHIQFLFVGSHL